MISILWIVYLFILIISVYFPIAHIVLRGLRRAHSAGFRKCKRFVCLTFDDGPDPITTPAILKFLRAQRVHSTFFVLGDNAKNYPEAIDAIKSGGHEIGEHGYSHLHPWKSLPLTYALDLVAGHKALDRLLGPSGHSLYRPTFGKANALTFAYVWLFRKTFAFWNVDPQDYRAESVSNIVDSVLRQIHLNKGASIVLFHDGRTLKWNKHKDLTAPAIEIICKELSKEGYMFRTVSELFDKNKRNS